MQLGPGLTRPLKAAWYEVTLCQKNWVLFLFFFSSWLCGHYPLALSTFSSLHPQKQKQKDHQWAYFQIQHNNFLSPPVSVVDVYVLYVLCSSVLDTLLETCAPAHIHWQMLSTYSMTGNGAVPWRHRAQNEYSSTVLNLFPTRSPQSELIPFLTRPKAWMCRIMNCDSKRFIYPFRLGLLQVNSPRTDSTWPPQVTF